MISFLMHHSVEIGLILFLVCFVLIAMFAFTRTRKELVDWSCLPLDNTGGNPASDQEDGK